MYIAHYSLFSKHIETLANTEDERRLRLSATENTGSHANMHTNPQAISLVREETSYTKGSAITPSHNRLAGCWSPMWARKDKLK